jgi:hypothetical protein
LSLQSSSNFDFAADLAYALDADPIPQMIRIRIRNTVGNNNIHKNLIVVFRVVDPRIRIHHIN